MKRRAFIALLGCAAVASPLAVRAQPSAMPVVGFLGSGSPDDQKNLTAATRQGLNEAGYVEGQNVTIEYRWAEGQYDRLPALAAGAGEPPGRLDHRCRRQRPRPGRQGRHLDHSDRVHHRCRSGQDRPRCQPNRPEANVTGISMIGSTLEAKRLELLHEVVPQASIIGAFINPNYPAAKAQTQEVQEAALRLGVGAAACQH